MRATEFLIENKVTLQNLYGGNFPDRDETFWDYVRLGELNILLDIKTLPKYKLAIMLQGQYRVEHLDEILDMMDEDQKEILQGYIDDPNLSKKTIVISGDRIIDGNHRALAAALKGVPIKYVDLADLDEQDVTEDTSKLNYIGNCTDDDVIEHLFGDATGFAQAVDEYGDDFELDDLVVKYDPDSDIHSFYYKQQGVTEDNENTGGDYAIHLGNLKRFFKGEDPLAELVPERRTHSYALYSDIFKDDQSAVPWRKTFASLTGKDFKEVLHNPKILGGYRPKKFSIPPGTLVGDMHLANMFYSKVFAKTPEEKQEIAKKYKESLVPFNGADLSKYVKPELLIPKQQGMAEGKQQVERNGIQLNVSIDGATVDIRPMINGNQVGYVVFDRDGKTLVADDLAIDEEYRGRGIAKIIYDYLKELGFTVKRSTDQLPAGKAFWDKYKGVQGQVWEDEHVDEMALSTYKTMGDFSKPGPFTGADKKLVPHPKNIEKATRFFEQTPFDFRLFFSHLKGTGKYSEHGPMSPDQIRQVFGKDAEEILNGSEDAITVVYVGNKGDSKVMLTPWMMAHRFGHAINAGARNKNWTAWGEAEKYFFQTVNNLLEEHYGKAYRGANTYRTEIKWDMTPEYNALFNAMGTQRSSTTGQIRRPYEFLYELFAQYLGTGKVTLNPLPTNLTYGRKVFGNPTKFMNIKPEYRDEGERKQAADSLAYTMELLFNDVLGDSVGKIFVM